MKITENNFQKVSARVHGLRQQWRCRIKVKDFVHQPASVTFFVLSVLCSYGLLSLFLLDHYQIENLGFVRYLGKAWEFLKGIFSVPGKPALSVLTVFLALYAISFLAAAVAAIIVAVKFQKEPIKKKQRLEYSNVSSMVTGLKIYQERINPLEGFHGKLNSILSLAFSLIITGLVAYIFGINKMFQAHWETFLGWAIFGTAILWIVHRLLLGILSFPVALLYCFAIPAPGLMRALEKKAEEIKPTYKYVDRPKTTVYQSSVKSSG